MSLADAISLRVAIIGDAYVAPLPDTDINL
jgi:hypothetical protein